MVAILIIFFGLNGNFIRDNNRMINFYLWYYLAQNFMTWCALIFSVVSGCIYMYNMYSPNSKQVEK
jgi:hypothetical protein